MQGVTYPTLGMVVGSCGQKYRHKPEPHTGEWVAHGNNFLLLDEFPHAACSGVLSALDPASQRQWGLHCPTASAYHLQPQHPTRGRKTPLDPGQLMLRMHQYNSVGFTGCFPISSGALRGLP